MNNWKLKIKTILLAPQNMKYLGTNMMKDLQDLCTENYKSLLGELKEDITNWRDILCSLARGLTIVKMSILPKLA